MTSTSTTSTTTTTTSTSSASASGGTSTGSTTVVVVGAAGKIGRRLVRGIVARGDVARAVVRKPAQVAELEALGAEGVLFDLEAGTADALAASLHGADAVVFTAGAGGGSGPERKQTVDHAGSVLLAEAARRAGVRRYVQVSAGGVDRPAAPDADPSWAAYVDAKARADAALRATDLDWTILRPGPLTDEPGTGAVLLSTAPDAAGEITRDDVAALVLACLDEPASIGAQWSVAGGAVVDHDGSRPGATAGAADVLQAVQDAVRAQSPA